MVEFTEVAYESSPKVCKKFLTFVKKKVRFRIYFVIQYFVHFRFNVVNFVPITSMPKLGPRRPRTDTLELV